MTDREWRRIRIDWEELEDAFADASTDHRYYLDRETGAVHFFSEYLDNEEEEEDERQITSESRYVLIPLSHRLVPARDLEEFVASLERDSQRKALQSSLGGAEGSLRFEEAIAQLPDVRGEWQRFLRDRLSARIERFLADVAVEPID